LPEVLPMEQNARSDQASPQIRAQAVYMFISALLFGYFGFFGSWTHQYTTDNPPALIPMVALLHWTLCVGAILFAGAGLLAAAGSRLGPLLNALCGLATAAIFLIVAIWEWTNPQGYYSGVPAIFLVAFAVWNGYGSWMGLQELRRPRSTPAPA
jgi:hypothetical protein